MATNKVSSPEEYLQQRVALLEAEKENTRARDVLAKQRRALPVTEVKCEYTFTSEQGEKCTLRDLFKSRPQLIVYHFMFDPGWEAGCPSCSLYADHIPDLCHLNGHSTTFVVVSRAPIEKINAYKKRMGWTFPWFSSNGTPFNYDYGVTQDESVAPVNYNFKTKQEMVDRGVEYFASGEQPGHSVFVLGGRISGIGEEGKVYHSYSSYARGGEHLVGTMSWLDMTPLGRQDGVSGVGGLGYKRHDEYTTEDLRGLPVGKAQAAAV